VGDTVFDAAELTAQPGYATVLGILDDWARAHDAIGRRSATADKKKGTALSQIHLRTPVLWPSAIYCAGANYRDHAIEMATRTNRPLDPDPKTIGGKPWHFLKATRCVTDPGVTVKKGAIQKFDWEVELVAVIGREARSVKAADALDYVAAYTIANDLSARDLSRRTEMNPASAFHYDWVSQKCFDGACPVGPVLVPADQIPDPQNLKMKLWVNDAIKQDSNTSEMIFTVAEQVEQLSRNMTLYPGDLILTGTPAGVGMGRGEFLKEGDVVKLEIERIGTLTNPIG
jgi:2-keto-4-pentenoate hydratase/2-oxohepta-3-ene-1,7-dioic acid hydratase in catechol pathway